MWTVMSITVHQAGPMEIATHVYTNDDVARVPRTDNPPPQPKPDTNNDRGRNDGDRNPKVVDQRPTRDTRDRGGDSNHGRDDHQGQPEPVRRSNNDGPPPPQTERQHNPPPQTFTPAPQRPIEHNMYTPPPAPTVHQPAPPPWCINRLRLPRLPYTSRRHRRKAMGNRRTMAHTADRGKSV